MIAKLVELKRQFSPGLIVAITLGMAATFLSEHYSTPAMLMALLIGLSFHFINEFERCSRGITFASTTILKLGVALLGVRITIADITSLGVWPVVMVVTSVIATLIFGIIMAKILGFKKEIGILTAGSVAICGASAAMAISSALTATQENKRYTLLTVISVTTLSTLAMVFYPLLTKVLGFSPQVTGMFLGGTIHDVAQVVGAGYSVSHQVGDVSTFVKLLRVSTLVPIVLLIGVSFNLRKSESQQSPLKITVPPFLIGFVVLVVINSSGAIPNYISRSLSILSSWMLITAVAALGVTTSLKDVITVGWRPIFLIFSETLFIALVVLGFCLSYFPNY